MNKQFRVTIKGPSYDTYLVEAKDAVTAFQKVRNYDGMDETVQEESLGEFHPDARDYRIEDLDFVGTGEEDLTEEVRDALLRETGAFRVVTEVRSDEDEACWELKPQWFVLWITKDLLERIESLYFAVRAIGAYEISEFCYRGTWLKEKEGEELSREEVLKKLDEDPHVAETRSLDAQTLTVRGTGEFRFEGYIKHTNFLVCSELLKIEEIRAKFNQRDKEKE